MSHFVFRSAGFTVYPSSGQVKSGNETISLGPVNMNVLLVLLASQGHVVSRSDIYQSVWGNQVVSDDALTRCISDLRSLLVPLANDSQLIETLPKRGYCWLPAVEKLEGEAIESRKSILLQYVLFSIASVILVIGIAGAALWYFSQPQQSPYMQMVIMPVNIERPEHRELAVELEDLLKQRVLHTTNMRFLSQRLMDGKAPQRYPYLTGEFGVQWVIEGDIRQKGEKLRVSLHLVDASTALVTFSVFADIAEPGGNLNDFTDEFISQVSQLLQPTQ